MGYTQCPTFGTGDMFDEADHNTYVVDNFIATVPDVFTTKGQLAAGTGANAMANLGVGSNGEGLITLASEATGLDYYANGYVESGMIIIWSGEIVDIPGGWVICDGQNSTPDLRNKFVIGAGGDLAVGATGGSMTADFSTHYHTIANTGSAGAHTHTITGVTTTATDGAHTHAMSSQTAASSDTDFTTAGSGVTVATSTHFHSYSGISHDYSYETEHAHGLPGSVESGGAHIHAGVYLEGGGSSSVNVTPRYYALAFIMKS